MSKLLQEIILNFQETDPEPGVPRRIRVTPVPGKATVCIGVRRSGKSTFLFQCMRRLREAGAPRENFLYLNFFDDRLRSLRADGLNLVLEAYFTLYPAKKNAEKIYCFFDEIQVVPGWEAFVDRLLRTERCEVYLAGSSAQLLSRELATEMRGRSLAWEIFPFSFREFLDLRGIDSTGGLSTRRRLAVQNAFADYWEAGGFPEIAGFEPALRLRTHQEYFGAILFRDLIERHDVAHPTAVLDLAHLLVSNPAASHSINRLTAFLKSQGHRAHKAAVADYLRWLEDAYALFSVRLFDASRARANANPKKIYCIDHALAASVGARILSNAGHLLENLVFGALRRRTPEVHYYRTRRGREVDFIAQHPDRSRQLVQVCETLSGPRARAREIAALTEAMAELRLREGVIVTRSEEEEIPVGPGVIRVVAAWRFLLEADGESEPR